MHTLEQAIEIVEKELKYLRIPSSPATLYDPVRYILSNGGKRIRPALALLAANLFTDHPECALGPALGVEVFHNFTLLHDDLMDKSVVRRGKPTVHEKWNSNIAILSGDVMAFMAGAQVAKVPEGRSEAVLKLFHRTAIEVCEGQMMDMSFESRELVSKEEYIRMIALKTAVLIAASLGMGALSAGSPEDHANRLYQFGLNLGIAFQLQDDLLDSYGDQETFGKKIGNDILTNKKTFLMITAHEKASPEDAIRLRKLYGTKPADPKKKIEEVMEIFNRCMVKEETEKAVNHYYKQALSELDSLGFPAEKTMVLRDMAGGLMGRKK